MNPKSQSRSAARLAAVQALYQHTMEEIPIPQLLHEFHTHRLGEEIDDDQFADADVAFFDDIVEGATARLAEIDALIEAKLASGWSLARLDRTLHQILRAGTYELLARPDVPVGSVINEYLDVAHAFFDAKDTRFANGLLDAIAKDVRR
ncbi:transcription antitermination factor NusB [Blastomonas aquatica]|uniref:Transcription antitermination protein NusB n=1 Tax=Blastomonas aquatica TaxID=1510276 RepID=A0ABQ1JF48_9SPHN|nr:transcription antitermination factor NusB [Blastomonas aquatica]GGB64811.1 N utilization substance protein B [Blastomonas aquatica]